MSILTTLDRAAQPSGFKIRQLPSEEVTQIWNVRPDPQQSPVNLPTAQILKCIFPKTCITSICSVERAVLPLHLLQLRAAARLEMYCGVVLQHPPTTLAPAETHSCPVLPKLQPFRSALPSHFPVLLTQPSPLFG